MFSPNVPGPVNPWKTPAVKPVMAADLSASLKLPPLISVAMPEPSAGPKTAPRGVNASAIGKTTGAIFLITLTTPLTPFVTPLTNF
jgi:hypothetical protein